MRLCTVVVSAAYLFVVAPLAAQDAGVVQDRLHVVGRGDTLWDLAQRYLSDAYRWSEIFSSNRERIANPHWIYPSQQILIPGLRPEAADATATVSPTPGVRRTVFFQGESAIMGGAGRPAQPPRPAGEPVVGPGTFYAAGILAPDSLVRPLGRLEEVATPARLSSNQGKQIHPFDHVHLSLIGETEVGSRVHFMRPAREVRPYGRIWISTGTGVVLDSSGGRATVEIDGMYDSLAPGDIAVPLPDFAVPSGVSPLPAGGQEGVLLAFQIAQPLAAREDIAYVSLGRESGVREGDEFVAYLPASTAEWGDRPQTDVATLQVVRVGARTSAVRVVAMQQPALREGMPVRLVARMP